MRRVREYPENLKIPEIPVQTITLRSSWPAPGRSLTPLVGKYILRARLGPVAGAVVFVIETWPSPPSESDSPSRVTNTES